jgi:hypothetical protein
MGTGVRPRDGTDNGESFTELAPTNCYLKHHRDGENLCTAGHGGGAYLTAPENDDTNWTTYGVGKTFAVGAQAALAWRVRAAVIAGRDIVIPTGVGYVKERMRREWLWVVAGALFATWACGGRKTASDDSDDHPSSGRAGVSGSGGSSGGRGGTASDGGDSGEDGGSAAGKAGAPARGGADSDGGDSGEDGGSAAGKAGARAGGGSAGGGLGGYAGGGDGGASATGATGGQGGSSGSAGANAGNGGAAGNAFGGAGNGGSGGVAGSGNAAGFSGTTGMGGSGGEPSVSCDASFAIGSDGFVRAPTSSGGCWYGYASAGGDVDSSWMPTSFGACGVGCMLRLSGTVNAATEQNSYAGVVFLGFSVRQAPGSSTRRTVVPTGTSLELDWLPTRVTGTGRVQISAGSSPSTRWCAPLTAPPNTVPYASFSTECWAGGQGTGYAKQPIDTVQIVLVGEEFPRTFDFRILSIKDA